MRIEDVTAIITYALSSFLYFANSRYEKRSNLKLISFLGGLLTSAIGLIFIGITFELPLQIFTSFNEYMRNNRSYAIIFLLFTLSISFGASILPVKKVNKLFNILSQIVLSGAGFLLIFVILLAAPR
jgi:hypothetical protein